MVISCYINNFLFKFKKEKNQFVWAPGKKSRDTKKVASRINKYKIDIRD